MPLIPIITGKSLSDINSPGSESTTRHSLFQIEDDVLENLLPLALAYLRSQLQTSESNESSGENVDQPSFKVSLDVQQFRRNEIEAKVVDNFIVVEASHEERPDGHGFVSRRFVRKYTIPDDIDRGSISCKLTSDGILMIEASKQAQEQERERVIPITRTLRPASSAVAAREAVAASGLPRPLQSATRDASAAPGAVQHGQQAASAAQVDA